MKHRNASHSIAMISLTTKVINLNGRIINFVLLFMSLCVPVNTKAMTSTARWPLSYPHHGNQNLIADHNHLTGYLVFFDFQSYRITPPARRVLNDAVAEMRRRLQAGTLRRVQIRGHVDRMDRKTALAYSQALAEEVSRFFIEQSIPKFLIQVSGVGFDEMLVPPGPNGWEPSNRRVEILFE